MQIIRIIKIKLGIKLIFYSCTIVILTYTKNAITGIIKILFTKIPDESGSWSLTLVGRNAFIGNENLDQPLWFSGYYFSFQLIK